MVVAGQSDLLDLVTARHAAGRLTGHLHRRQKQRNEYADNGDRHQQLDQRECAA
jgi:hypothetical protein